MNQASDIKLAAGHSNAVTGGNVMMLSGGSYLSTAESATSGEMSISSASGSIEILTGTSKGFDGGSIHVQSGDSAKDISGKVSFFAGNSLGTTGGVLYCKLVLLLLLLLELYK